MEKRAQLILDRARKLFDSAHPGEAWHEMSDRSDPGALERQAQYLAHAEDQLLKEGIIKSVDQS